MKKIVFGLLNAALISAFVFGGESARTFGAWLVGVMVAIMLIGSFGIDRKTAEQMYRTSTQKAYTMIVGGSYIAAMIYAGFPILSAAYAIAVMATYAASERALNEEVKA